MIYQIISTLGESPARRCATQNPPGGCLEYAAVLYMKTSIPCIYCGKEP